MSRWTHQKGKALLGADMPVGTWHQAANAVDDNSVGGLSASGNAVNNVETVLGGMQTMGDI